MSVWNTVDTFQRTVTVRGVELDVDIKVDACPDDNYPNGNFDFGDADENVQYLARFHSGELEMTLVRVRATWKGVAGVDYLGACHILGREYETDVKDTVFEYAMTENALADLVREIESVQLAK